jgi:hypothetical protein
MSAARKRHGPIRPETWAITMLCMMGFCGAGALVLYFLGGMSLLGLGGILLLLLLGAFSTLLRYLYNTPPSE